MGIAETNMSAPHQGGSLRKEVCYEIHNYPEIVR